MLGFSSGVFVMWSADVQQQVHEEWVERRVKESAGLACVLVVMRLQEQLRASNVSQLLNC